MRMIYINLTSLSEVLVSAFLQAAALSYITYGTQNKKDHGKYPEILQHFWKTTSLALSISQLLSDIDWINKIAVINTETWQSIICMIKVKIGKDLYRLSFRNNFIIDTIINGLMRCWIWFRKGERFCTGLYFSKKLFGWFAGPDFPIGRVGQRPRAHRLRGAHRDQNTAMTRKAV